LYQIQDSAPYPTANLPVALDSNGDVFEMDSDSIRIFGSRLAELANTNDYPGTFKLSSSAPSAEYSKWIDTVFSDTTASASVDYHIWQRKTMSTPPSTPSHYALRLRGTGADLKEMTVAELQSSMWKSLLAGQQATGVGSYQLRTSAEGAPTDPGTWVSVGSAVDTRNLIDSDAQYTGTFISAFYTSQYSRQYTGTYINYRPSVVPANFSGIRQVSYTGSRTYAANYSGSRNYASGAGQYAGSRNYSADYAGSRNYSGNYAGSRTFTSTSPFYLQNEIPFSGFRQVPGNFAGTRVSAPTQFAGTRVSNPANFVGERTFVGLRSHIDYFPANYSGFRQASIPDQFGGSRVYVGQSLLNQYSGPANYTGTRQVPGQFTGIRSSGFNPTPIGPVPYIGYGTFAGTRVSSPTPFAGYVVYAGSRTYAGNYAGSRLGPTPGNFLGFGFDYYIGNRSFIGNRQFTGNRQVPGQFTGNRQVPGTFAGDRPSPANFIGQRTFIGSRTFVGQYGGSRNYASSPTQYSGSRNYASFYGGSRNYAGSYGGSRNYASTGDQYLGPGASNFAGSRLEQYTGFYTGQYTRQYTGQFTSSFTTQFTGDTLTATPETIQTYTLYRKVAQ
jgi:hypothetical protein